MQQKYATLSLPRHIPPGPQKGNCILTLQPDVLYIAYLYPRCYKERNLALHVDRPKKWIQLHKELKYSYKQRIKTQISFDSSLFLNLQAFRW